CATCHTPELSGSNGPVPLYSNLLLHDIHEADFRGMAEPQAPVGFYRTPTLWGLRKSAPYLHDGRASTIEQAIEMHFDEANLSRQNYMNLTVQEREELLLFLNDL
ncbi:MAG: di-heme oxidoredictase family protein, partial [Planctomycetota bacterium]|nr:di-heme oxidoredictase family protein [Planctomycetota bacterium]